MVHIMRVCFGLFTLIEPSWNDVASRPTRLRWFTVTSGGANSFRLDHQCLVRSQRAFDRLQQWPQLGALWIRSITRRKMAHS
jgi:hypothetical protein